MRSSFKPSVLYDHDIKIQKVNEDVSQEQILKSFDSLYLALENPNKSIWPFTKKTIPQGIYLYGSVGRGKTYLMDLFYESLSISKLRIHFYAFMANIHMQLKMLQGEVNPLQKIVELFARQTKVLCLDEFFIEDIADAMILASLLDSLFKAEVIVVITSNVAPQNLYKEGLKRDRFLPAIALIEKHMQVLSLDHPTDYRKIHDFKSKNYHFPLTTQHAYLNYHFEHLRSNAPLLDKHFTLNDWAFIACERSTNVVWFDFAELCAKPRSSIDYLDLAKTYNAILLQNVPILDDENGEAARRFITLVDTTYDAHVVLILSANVPLVELYQGKRLSFEFERTQSRLIEMAGWV